MNNEFIVNPTNIRENPNGHFLVQLNQRDAKSLNFRHNEDIVITNKTGKIDEKKNEIIFQIKGRLQIFYDRDTEEEERIEDGYILMDQTLRAAIGVGKGSKVTLGSLEKKIRKPIPESLFGFGKQLNVARVLIATFTDMEVDICRLEKGTMGSIGVDEGDKIIVESVEKKITIRALNLNEKTSKSREEKREKEASVYAKRLRFTALKDKYKIDDDLPWVFIDFDARKKLNIEPGDPVTIYRSNSYAISKNIQSLTLPLILTLFGVVMGLDYLVIPILNNIIPLALLKGVVYLLGVLLIIYLNLRPIKNKFK